MAFVWLTQDETCGGCNGGRSCPNNCSSGKVDSGATDIKGKAIMINCGTCNGSGVCPTCSGNGTVPVRRRVQE